MRKKSKCAVQSQKFGLLAIWYIENNRVKCVSHPIYENKPCEATTRIKFTEAFQRRCLQVTSTIVIFFNLRTKNVRLISSFLRNVVIHSIPLRRAIVAKDEARLACFKGLEAEYNRPRGIFIPPALKFFDGYITVVQVVKFCKK
ncbi:hypothetical protein EGR_02063 [Echinococcus granulosus]|uniref:Uncharacterized protein n=1 Tax=Echinococcus granulosus TaxID=6210 RepID=W6V8X0_ECHGR|nr:hypothetical protein EGR_02063 [Echinococcus granulosus]EUB62969.1 hypothetical protein EGR_02063 [Echinococcus granulosus]